MNDKVCKRSSVGSSIVDMRVRMNNYRSHIRSNYKKCEFVNHISENPALHPLPDPTTFTSKNLYIDKFNESLSEQIEIILIDKVIFPPHINDTATKKNIISKVEGYWQTQLHTLERFGGLNIRDERKIANVKCTTGTAIKTHIPTNPTP